MPSVQSSDKLSAPSTSLSVPSLSAAPSVIEKPKVNYYATLPPSSATDPYPGFHITLQGQWAPDEPEAWAEWCLEQGWTETQIETVADDGMIEVEGPGTGEEKQGPEKPSKVPTDDLENKPQVRHASTCTAEPGRNAFVQLRVVAKGRGRHQLASLLSEAHNNRAELEEKISQAKANRKSSAVKYGKSCTFLSQI